MSAGAGVGNRVYLNLTDGPDPENSNTIGAHQLGYNYDIPPAWFTLFEATDIVITDHGDGDEPEIYLITDIHSALESLHARSAAMSVALGDRWDIPAPRFEPFLRDPAATHIVVYLTELAELTGIEDLRALIRTRIGAFDVPYHSGAKTLFTRKPKVSEAWQELLAPFRHYARGPKGHKAWVVFGCPDELDFDSP